LLPQGRWNNHQNAPPAFRPVLGEHKPGFDRFTQADLVGEEHTLGKGGAYGEESCINLMGIQVDARIRNCTRQLVDRATRRSQRQLRRPVLALEGCG